MLFFYIYDTYLFNFVTNILKYFRIFVCIYIIHLTLLLKMNRLSMLLAAITVALAASAQSPMIKVQYEASKPVISLAKGTYTKTNKMSLVSSPDRSLYFNDMSLYCDSMTSTPEGKRQLRKIQWAAFRTVNPDGSVVIDYGKGNAPLKNVYTYVAKDFKAGTERVYGKWMQENGYYDEPLDEISWTVGDSITTILGYECIQAFTDYHGRRWTAWFAPEIPLGDGPWKLAGLPGLVMRAESGPEIRFEAVGIEKYEGTMPFVYQTDTYDKVKRLEALANEDYYQNNRESIINTQSEGKIKVLTPIKSVKYEPEIHALETDYATK